MLENEDGCHFFYHNLPELNQIPDFIHGFLTRQPDVVNLDELEKRNSQLLTSLGVDSSRIALLKQVHSNRVMVVSRSDQWRAWPERLGEADGVVVLVPGHIPVLRTADCVPVIALAPNQRAVGLFHAGWRGLRSRIVSRGLMALMEAAGAARDEVRVGIGPCIRSCCYEVGSEVLDAFEGEGYARNDISNGRHLDLAAVARMQVAEVGIRSWIDPGICCACRNERFYSYRKEATPLRTWTFAGFAPGD
jgi:YfiH family protein